MRDSAEAVTSDNTRIGGRFRSLMGRLMCLVGSRVDDVSRKTGNNQFMAMGRGVVLLLCLFAVFVMEVRFSYNLQVTKHDEYDRQAKIRTRTSYQTVGSRGQIYDLNGTLLVGNIFVHNVYCEPKRLNDVQRAKAIALFEEILGIPSEKTQENFARVTNAPVSVTLDCDLPLEAAEEIDRWKLPYVTVSFPMENATDGLRIIVKPHLCTAAELSAVLERMSPLVNRKKKELNAQVTAAIQRPREIIVKTGVEFTVGEKLKAAIAENKLPGIRIEGSTVRYYPQDEMLSNLLGYLDSNRKGGSGIEKLLNSEMTPEPGKIHYQRNSRGDPLSAYDIKEIPPKDGADVYLTIVSPLQKIAEEELAKSVEKYHPERAYAIMMNPKTGAIMALAQFPTFNPNDRRTFRGLSNIQNHCLLEVYEPGSIMKPLPIAYALDKGIVTNDSRFFCEGGRWLYCRKVLRDTHRNGNLTVKDIIAVSSNIGTAKIGLEMGNNVLYNAFREFGMGQRTGIGFIPEDGKDIVFKNESKGLFRALERWDKLSPTRFPIGQGIACTPLQLLQAYGAIANGGVMMQPYLIERMVKDGVETRSVPRQKGQPISALGARRITEDMIEVVASDEGTGKRARLDGYEIAGKTGTGQICVNGHYEEKLFTSSFVGFVPAWHPEFVLIVSVRGVKVHGGTACGPVFKGISERTLAYLNVEPDKVDNEGKAVGVAKKK